MKKKIFALSLVAVCSALTVTGCRSRITASSEADEIKNAEDALADAADDTGAGQKIKNSMSDMTEKEIEDRNTPEEELTETQPQEDNQTQSEEPETENEKISEVTIEEIQNEDSENSGEDNGNEESEEIPEVTTTPPEKKEDEDQDGDRSEKDVVPKEDDESNPGDDKNKNNEADRKYSQDQNVPGNDRINTNSDNKSGMGEGNNAGNGSDGGEGGNNAGNAPGIGSEDPTVPPQTPAASEEEPEEFPTPPEEIPTEKEPESEEPEIFVTVSFDPAGGSISDGSSKELKVGDVYGILPECYKNGYTFGGWYTLEDGTGERITDGTIVTNTQDHTLHAFYVQRELHNVHFVTEGLRGNYWLGNAAEENRQIYVGDTYGSEFPVPRTRLGYTFLGWYDAPSGGNFVSPSDIFTANTDIELYAHMEYDPLVYWTGILNNVNGYPCQNRGMICEYDQANVPVINSVFIARLGTGPIQSADSSSVGLTTEEILKNKPNTSIMVKIISDMNNAEAVAGEVLNRFSVEYPYYRQLYIIPSEAESGDPATTLIYNLAIKMELWPESFTRDQAINPWGLEAVNKAVEELGVPYPTIVHYGQ